jgi:exopolysaccharide production protein ExoZ
MNPTTNADLKALQILRAVAATSVIYFHTFASPHFGAFGVDIFFVISGFVMAMIVAKGQTAANFALQRVIRIVPLYWLLTTIFLFAAKLRPDLAPSTDPSLLDYIRSLFFVPYFKQDGTLCPILTVGWTLDYEMFFYLCVFGSILSSRRHYLAITFGLLLTSYTIFGKAAASPVAGAFFGNEIVIEFVFGLLLFKLYTKKMSGGSARTLFAGAICAYCLMALAETYHLHGNRAIVFGVPSALLVYCGIGMEDAIGAASAKVVGIFVGIGNASYATYLTHYFVIQVVKKLLIQKMNLDFNLFVAAAALIAALITGHIVDQLIDKPMNRALRGKLRSLLDRPANAAPTVI